jgi:hypothetical protein
MNKLRVKKEPNMINITKYIIMIKFFSRLGCKSTCELFKVNNYYSFQIKNIFIYTSKLISVASAIISTHPL